MQSLQQDETHAAFAGQAYQAYLEKHPAALSAWRAHQWLWQSASADQFAKAALIADAELSAAECDLPTEMTMHNMERVAGGLPAVSFDEFVHIVRHAIIHIELLKSIETGQIQ